MNSFRDLNSYGYQIIERIEDNYQGGRITWKAVNLNSNQFVVIKQFCFATTNSTWSGYKAYQQEISILQNLNHPYIPQYLENFETKDGFCLVQKYIKAQNLNKKNNFSILQIKLIAKKILKILVYLQKQNPPILHQDIQPKNILIDDLENIYLVNFGFARRLNDIDESSITLIAGTPGFIAPEQKIKPTKSSDLYSLGITIICLLTNKKSSEIVELITPTKPYEINFQSLISNIDSDFVNWLQKMIHPQVSKRFIDAKSALKALKELDWDLQENTMTLQQEPWSKNTSLSTQEYSFSTLVMGLLGIATAIGFHVTNRVTDKTIINITIAAIATIIVYIAQYAAVTAFKTDPEGKTEAIILAVATPITLTVVAGFIFGRGEAVAMSIAVTIAQTAILTTILWQKLAKNPNLLKIIGLLSAILLGFILGLKITI